jgi:hypothetical protein
VGLPEIRSPEVRRAELGRRAVADQDVDKLLARIAERTADIATSPSFVDRTMAAIHADAGSPWTGEPDDRLADLRNRTDALDAPPDLTERVMEAVRAEGPASMPSSSRVSKRSAFADGLARSGIRAMALAAAVAAASVIYATYAERALDSGLVSTIDSVEGTD